MNPKVTFVFDGSFKGLLTCVFESYMLRLAPHQIVRSTQFIPSLSEDAILVKTDPQKAKRVSEGLGRKITLRQREMIWQVYLSELPEIELMLLNYMKIIFDNSVPLISDYRDPVVLRFSKVHKMVSREVHRMYAFVRFKKQQDNCYFASIIPDFNILPLIADHFLKRYQDQKWLIYDVKRRYGIYFDMEKLAEVEIDLKNSGDSIKHNLDKDQLDYEKLWNTYYNSVNIPERKNLKLHIRHLPKRYWRHLTEKGFTPLQ